MGLEKGNGSKATVYVKIKEGMFYTSDDKEHQNPYGMLYGKIVGFNYRDEDFGKQKIRKFQISLLSDGTKYVLSLPVESPAYSDFISFAKNLDLTGVINLHATYETSSDASGNPIGKNKVLLSTGSESTGFSYAKKYFTKNGPNKLPPFKQVNVSGKTLWDKTDYLAFLADVVENDLKPSLSSATVSQGPVIFKEEGDDLPF